MDYKNTFYPLCAGLLLTLWAAGLGAQTTREEGFFKGYIHAGANIAQIDGDGPHGFRYFGPRAGIGAYFFVHKRLLSLGFEMNYSRRGSRGADYIFSGIEDAITFTQTLDYVEVPFLLRVHDKRKAFAQIGLAPSFLVSDQLRYSWLIQPDRAAPSCLTEPFARADLSILGGLYFYVTPRIGLGGAFNYSLRSLRPSCGRPDTVTRGQYHRIVTLSALYLFGKPKEED